MLGEIEIFYTILFIGNLTIILLFFSSFTKSQYLKISTAILSAVITSLLLCMRKPFIALDAYKYIFLFEKNKAHYFFSYHIYDLGYIILNLFLRLFTDSYNIFLFIITFLHISTTIFLYKNLNPNHFTLLLAIYFSTFVFWLSNLSMLRQGMAIPILAVAICYLIFYKKKILFFLLAVLSGSIHYSAFATALFTFFVYLLFNNLSKSYKKLVGFIFILLIIYPENIFINIMLNIFSSISNYGHSLPTIDKIIWYFNWNKFYMWHIKHVYFLILLLFTILLLKERDDKVILLSLIPLSFLGLLKYDEMVTDRIFMYFVPFIPFFLYRVYRIYSKIPIIGKFALVLLFVGILIWFNIKLMYLQYPGWFIYPYPSVR